MTAPNIHVEPNAQGRWIVRLESERKPLSEHESATDAQRAACDLAQVEGAAVVLLRDRYARVRRVPIEATATAEPCARDQRARTRRGLAPPSTR